MFLLDTNICIYVIKRRPENVLFNLKKRAINELKISSITVAELMYGVEKSQNKEKNRTALAKFLSPFDTLPFTDEDAATYGTIRSSLESKGLIIGPYDLQIAAQALNRSLILVTNNEKEFNRISDLRVENWIN